MNKIGYALKTIRVMRGYSQRQAEKISNVGWAHICAMENNKTKPNLDTLANLADGYDVPVSLFFMLGEDLEKYPEIEEVVNKIMANETARLKH